MRVARPAERGRGRGVPVWCSVLFSVCVAALLTWLLPLRGRTVGTEVLPSVTEETSGLTEVGERVFRVDRAGASLVETFSEPATIETVTVDLLEQPEETKSLWQRLGFDAGTALTVSVSTKAPGDSLYSDEVTQTVLSDNPSTETIVLPHRDGPVNEVRIRLSKSARGAGFTLARDIAFNEPVPTSFSLPLFVILAAVLVLVTCCLPWSALSHGTAAARPRQTHVVLGVTVVVLCLAAVVSTQVTRTAESHYSYFEYAEAIVDTQQYQHQADAILAGHADLDLPVPDWLREADDPYDIDVRRQESVSTGESYYFDYAFHDGRYYCYFGVLPAVTLFVPYKAVTGRDLTNSLATEILAVLAVVSVSGLAVRLLGRVDGHVSVAELLLAVVAAVTLSGVVFLAFYPSFYHIAILSALVCATGGLALWLRADRGPRVSRPSLALGSLLVGGCLLSRPVTFLVVLTAFPVFGHRFWHVGRERRSFFGPTREARVNTSLVVVPILAMGVCALWWNYARFGSVLDFGYTYNLTGFDMTTKALDLRRNLFGLAMYLVAPLGVQARYPFMRGYSVSSGWLATVFQAIPGLVFEPYYGGALAFWPFLAAAVLLVGRRTREMARCRRVLSLALVAGVLGIAIALFDAGVAITQRYQSDFSWLLGVPALCAAAACEEHLRARGSTVAACVLRVALVAAVAFSVCVCLINLLALYRYNSLRTHNPQVWWSCYAWFLGSV